MLPSSLRDLGDPEVMVITVLSVVLPWWLRIKWRDKRLVLRENTSGGAGGGAVLRIASVWVGEGGLVPSLARAWLSDGFLSC